MLLLSQRFFMVKHISTEDQGRSGLKNVDPNSRTCMEKNPVTTNTGKGGCYVNNQLRVMIVWGSIPPTIPLTSSLPHSYSSRSVSISLSTFLWSTSFFQNTETCTFQQTFSELRSLLVTWALTEEKMANVLFLLRFELWLADKEQGNNKKS